MILDNLLRYREAQSAPVSFSVAHKWLKNGVLNRRGDTGAIIPDTNLQAASTSARGYHDPPRVGRNRLASIQDKVGDHSLEAVGIEPPHGQAFMMMLDADAPKSLSYTYHPDRALDCINDVSGGGLTRVTILGALQQ
jgi:hypothetical protein